MRLLNIKIMIWEWDMFLFCCKGFKDLLYCIFFFKEMFVVVWGKDFFGGFGVYIFDVFLGDIYYIFFNSRNVVDCKFVGDEECFVYNRGINVFCVFNVRLGDLLIVMDIEE